MKNLEKNSKILIELNKIWIQYSYLRLDQLNAKKYIIKNENYFLRF